MKLLKVSNKYYYISEITIMRKNDSHIKTNNYFTFTGCQSPTAYVCIQYKLSLTTHKAIHHNSPDYLASLLHLYTPITPLQTRSSNTFILTTSHLHKLHSSNIRSFALSAPYHWNSLPNHLRTNTSTPSFKRHLTTYYVSLAFPPTQ